MLILFLLFLLAGGFLTAGGAWLVALDGPVAQIA